MKETIFRGKYKNSFVFGSLVIGMDENEEKFHQIERAYFHEHRVYDIEDPETIGQYIGVKKSGDAIFEGDILESFVHEDVPLLHIVEWSDKLLGWYFRNAKDVNNIGDGSVQAFVYFNNSGVNAKVVGNIHDNPELIK